MQKRSFLNVRSLFAASFNDILDVIVSANIELVADSEVSSSQVVVSLRNLTTLRHEVNGEVKSRYHERPIFNIRVLFSFV